MTVYTTPLASEVTTSEVTVAGTVVMVWPLAFVVVTAIADVASDVTSLEVVVAALAGRMTVDVPLTTTVLPPLVVVGPELSGTVVNTVDWPGMVVWLV